MKHKLLISVSKPIVLGTVVERPNPEGKRLSHLFRRKKRVTIVIPVQAINELDKTKRGEKENG